jgi:HK97 family phage major capsid protein
LSDGLKAKEADLIERLEALSKKAADENRLFTDDEARAWDVANGEVRDIDMKLERQLASEELRRGGKGARRAVDDQGREHAILTKAQKLADRHPPRDGQPLDIAKALKGMITGDWREAEMEQLAMSVGSLPGGGFSVPSELSAQWIDMARAKAVTIAAGSGTIEMQTMTLRIAEIVGDVAPAFRPENTPLPENDVVFGALDLKARLIGVVTRASLELISDSPIASDMITTSITQSLGVAMDAAMLSGDGVVDATHDNPRGILN